MKTQPMGSSSFLLMNSLALFIGADGCFICLFVCFTPWQFGVGGVDWRRLHTAAPGPDAGKYSSSKVHPRQLCR